MCSGEVSLQKETMIEEISIPAEVMFFLSVLDACCYSEGEKDRKKRRWMLDEIKKWEKKKAVH